MNIFNKIRESIPIKKEKIEKQTKHFELLDELSAEQRMIEVNAIKDTLGYKIIMDDARTLSNDVRDVSVLGANYGNKSIDKQLGTLGGAGLIASHIINSFIENYE